MSKTVAWILLVVGGLCAFRLADAAAPVDTATVAPIENLKAESAAKLSALEKLLSDGGSFEESKKRQIPQAAGVLACLAQAIGEHKDREKSGVAAADLRDAAIALVNSASHDDAEKALATAKQAFEGKGDGKAAPEHEWNKLINLHRLMEEVNARNSKIRVALRRPKDPQAESLHATTLAVLALAMHADTHEVKDKSQIPQWQKHAGDYQRNMTALAAAIKAKDKDRGNELFKAAQKSCNDCHKAFRKEE